jgi:hypothetical protein
MEEIEIKGDNNSAEVSSKGFLRVAKVFQAICSDRDPICTDRVFALGAKCQGIEERYLADHRTESEGSSSETKKPSHAAVYLAFMRINQKGPLPDQVLQGNVGSMAVRLPGVPNSDGRLDFYFGPHVLLLLSSGVPLIYSASTVAIPWPPDLGISSGSWRSNALRNLWFCVLFPLTAPPRAICSDSKPNALDRVATTERIIWLTSDILLSKAQWPRPIRNLKLWPGR